MQRYWDSEMQLIFMQMRGVLLFTLPSNIILEQINIYIYKNLIFKSNITDHYLIVLVLVFGHALISPAHFLISWVPQKRQINQIHILRVIEI